MSRKPKAAYATRDEALKTKILAVKLRTAQVKLRILESNTPLRALGGLTPLPDDTLVHLRLPPELDVERNPYDKRKLAYAREIGLAPPAEGEPETIKVEPAIEPDYTPQPPHPNEATDPEYKALMDRVRETLANYNGLGDGGD